MRALLSWLGALAFALALAAPATAQDPQVDPDSPAGTEYQLPTDRARDEASGDVSRGSSDDGAAGEAPLFGEGVKKKTAGVRPGSDSDPRTTANVEPDLGTRTPETVRAQASAPDGGGSGLVAIAGGAGGVLLLGGLGGLVWRRRTMRP